MNKLLFSYYPMAQAGEFVIYRHNKYRDKVIVKFVGDITWNIPIYDCKVGEYHISLYDGDDLKMMIFIENLPFLRSQPLKYVYQLAGIIL